MKAIYTIIVNKIYAKEAKNKLEQLGYDAYITWTGENKFEYSGHSTGYREKTVLDEIVMYLNDCYIDATLTIKTEK